MPKTAASPMACGCRVWCSSRTTAHYIVTDVLKRWPCMKLSPEVLSLENALAERAAGYWLLGAAVVALLPHVARLPVWLSAVLAALFDWRFLMVQRAWPAPNRWWRWSLTALLVFLIYRQYGTLLGRDAGSALLAAMLALKFLELQRLGGYVLRVLLVYFLIVLGFLYSHAVWLG